MGKMSFGIGGANCLSLRSVTTRILIEGPTILVRDLGFHHGV
jgi:hypothetical protein